MYCQQVSYRILMKNILYPNKIDLYLPKNLQVFLMLLRHIKCNRILSWVLQFFLKHLQMSYKHLGWFLSWDSWINNLRLPLCIEYFESSWNHLLNWFLQLNNPKCISVRTNKFHNKFRSLSYHGCSIIAMIKFHPEGYNNFMKSLGNIYEID